MATLSGDTYVCMKHDGKIVSVVTIENRNYMMTPCGGKSICGAVGFGRTAKAIEVREMCKKSLHNPIVLARLTDDGVYVEVSH